VRGEKIATPREEGVRKGNTVRYNNPVFKITITNVGGFGFLR